MKWKEDVTLRKEQEHWYLQDEKLRKRIPIESRYHALAEILEAGVATEAELIGRLADQQKEKEIIIDCMVAEFYLKYVDYLQRNPETELQIEV